MSLKKFNMSLVILLISVLIFTGLTFATAEEEIFDPDIPDSWYEEPKPASEWEISKFNQSPMLDEMVENGEIPPVEDRLPKDPPVIEPYDEVGKYGGTMNEFSTFWDYNSSDMMTLANRYAVLPTPDASKVVPYYIKDWEYSDEFKKVTVYLREGMKWSDGEPLTTDDIMFWWEYVAHNEELTPVPPEEWSPISLLDVKKEGEYSVSFHFNKSDPHRHKDWVFMPEWLGHPKHYMKQFHPEFVDKEELEEKAKKVDLDYWFEYYERMSSIHEPDRGVRPTILPYVVTERGETYKLLERNPYFPFVDTEGNQLPYIDKIRQNVVNDKDMLEVKASTGEATLATVHLEATSLPMFKKNEEKGNYEARVFSASYGSFLALIPNLTHKDPEKREILQNVKFRRALSLAMDRENINSKVFYGNATERQASLIPGSTGFKPEYAESYSEYNPERAKKLLDDIGMIDVDDDGYRETPDGNDFKITLEYNIHAGPRTPVLELVREDYKDIGLEFELKVISWELIMQHRDANNFDMGEWKFENSNDLRIFNDIKQLAPTWSSWTTPTPWPRWLQWYNSKGEKGEEPPEEIKELNDYAETARYSTEENKRKEALQKLAEAQAENLWTIGTVGLEPMVVIVKNGLYNVAKKGYHGNDTGWLLPYYPSQFYLDE